MQLKIEYLNKQELKPYLNNAKLHPAEQVEQIKKSIEQFGFNDPIAIWHDNEIIEGHGRLLAVMEMDDIEQVPVIRLDNLTDEERRAYALVHNKLTMNTGFDLGLIEEELAKVSDIDMDYYGFKAAADIAEDLENFFVQDEQAENRAESSANTTTEYVFTVSPTPENRGELLNFLNREGFTYNAK